MAKKFEEYEIIDIMELAAREFAFGRTCECGKPMGFSLYPDKETGKPRASKSCYECNMAKKTGGAVIDKTVKVDVPAPKDLDSILDF